MKIKPAIPNANPKALARLKSPVGCPPFQAWILAATLPDRTGEALITGAVAPTLPDSGLEQLSTRVVQAVSSAPVSTDPHKIVVAFHSGWLQGVTCVVVVEGRRVQLLLRADGARQRDELLRGRRMLAGRLGTAGFSLGGYEVAR